MFYVKYKKDDNLKNKQTKLQGALQEKKEEKKIYKLASFNYVKKI